MTLRPDSKMETIRRRNRGVREGFGGDELRTFFAYPTAAQEFGVQRDQLAANNPCKRPRSPNVAQFSNLELGYVPRHFRASQPIIVYLYKTKNIPNRICPIGGYQSVRHDWLHNL
jgi:hypothetical protein